MTDYPLELPAVKSFATLTIRRRNVVGITEAPYSLSQQTQDHGGQRWEGEFTLPPMKRADADEWGAFFDELNGPKGTFLAGDPSAAIARGEVRLNPNSVTVDGNGQTGQSLNVQAALSNTPFFFRKGDFFQLGTGATTRLYSCTRNASLLSGKATLLFWPRLRITPADNAAVVVASPRGIWRMITPAPERFKDASWNSQFSGVAIREAV